MSTADTVVSELEIAERVASAIAQHFGLDHAEVVRIAKGALPELAPTPPAEDAYLDAREHLLHPGASKR